MAVGKAQWLVTGDQDLLSLSDEVNFQIIEPAAAIALPGENRAEDAPSSQEKFTGNWWS